MQGKREQERLTARKEERVKEVKEEYEKKKKGGEGEKETRKTVW